MHSTRKLLSVCTIVSKKPSAYEGSKKYIATGDVAKSEIVSSTDVTFENRPSRANCTVSEGDVLLAKMAETDKVLIATSFHEDMIFSTGFLPLRPNLEIIDTKFLYYVLSSDKFQSEKNRLSSGSTQKAINIKSLSRIEIPVPSLKEQRRIVKILDLSKRVKQRVGQRKALAQSFVKATFHDMFELENENMGMMTLEQVSKIIDCPHSTPTYSNDPTGYFCVRSQDLTDEGELVFDKMMEVSEETYLSRISRHTPKKGDILFLREGSIGRVTVIPDDVKICLGQRIMILSPNQDLVLPSYLHNLILSDRFQFSLNRLKMGTTAGRVNIKDLRGLLIPIPTLSKQRDFEKILISTNSSLTSIKIPTELYLSLNQELLA